MTWRLFWFRKRKCQASSDATEKLEQVVADDHKVDELVSRATRILRENNFAPNVMRALGVRR